MNVYFLYEDKEWKNIKRYSDAQNIIQDLGLATLFSISAREIVYKEKEVESLMKEDTFLAQTMRSVMMVPLTTEEELLYRQNMVKDAFRNERFIYELYDCTEDMLKEWDALGRKVTGKGTAKDSSRKLLYDIQVLKLFVETLGTVKRMFKSEVDRFTKGGFRAFYARLCEEFSDEKEAALKQIFKDIVFFTNDFEIDAQYNTQVMSKIIMGCTLTQGLKCSDFVVEEVSTSLKKTKSVNNIFGKMQEYMNAQKPITAQKDPNLQNEITDLQNEVVRYIISICKPFMADFEEFWDQLRFQLGFFKGAIILRRHIWRYDLTYCFPKVCAQEDLRFENLKEFVMAVEQKNSPVGNTCDISDKMLLVITGANQGGKSTFLRSVGIAQIMMQCGLPVVAASYESGIFPSFFTHFTRREDSAMNSGRLDEELNRMSQIIDHLKDGAMVLLNESFATTTEKEGSVIAYDIIKALTEANVKVLTVTHLLSFAQRIYKESKEAQTSHIEFFSAQREESGKRTYKMIQHEPELTSFGIDLYEEIIGC